MATKIIWTGSPDNMTAYVQDIEGEYILRCEEINKRGWWWAVYFNGFQIDMAYSDIPSSIEEAKAAAINAMNEHLKENL